MFIQNLPTRAWPPRGLKSRSPLRSPSYSILKLKLVKLIVGSVVASLLLALYFIQQTLHHERAKAWLIIMRQTK